jgi:hypothetical protein
MTVLFLLLSAGFAGGAGLLMKELLTAPEAFEDESGFHLIRAGGTAQTVRTGKRPESRGAGFALRA